MDPFFKVAGSAVAIMITFLIAVVGGHLTSALIVKGKEERRLVTVAIALAIFLIIFLLFLRPGARQSVA